MRLASPLRKLSDNYFRKSGRYLNIRVKLAAMKESIFRITKIYIFCQKKRVEILSKVSYNRYVKLKY